MWPKYTIFFTDNQIGLINEMGIHTVLTYVEGEKESKSEKHPKHVGDENVYQGENTNFTIGFGIH